MCGCGQKAGLTTAAQRASVRWQVQFPSGTVKTYLSEAEARIAHQAAPGSTLLAPTS